MGGRKGAKEGQVSHSMTMSPKPRMEKGHWPGAAVASRGEHIPLSLSPSLPSSLLAACLTAARGESNLTGPSRLVATLSITPPGDRKTK